MCGRPLNDRWGQDWKTAMKLGKRERKGEEVQKSGLPHLAVLIYSQKELNTILTRDKREGGH